jgi:hypothetical protein
VPPISVSVYGAWELSVELSTRTGDVQLEKVSSTAVPWRSWQVYVATCETNVERYPSLVDVLNRKIISRLRVYRFNEERILAPPDAIGRKGTNGESSAADSALAVAEVSNWLRTGGRLS